MAARLEILKYFAQHFTWPKAANKMLSVYQKLVTVATNFNDEVPIV
jgi:hypothetical protein